MKSRFSRIIFSPKFFRTSFEVREINVVIIFLETNFYIHHLETFLVIIRFMHGSNIFCMKSMLEPYILFITEKCGDIMFYKFE